MLLARNGGEGGISPSSPDEHVPLLNHHGAAIGLTVTFTALAWLCSLLRLYTRLVILNSPWWDDVFTVLALVSTTGCSVVFGLLQNVGMGRHFGTLTLDERKQFMKVFYVGCVTYPLALLFIKLALLFQYLRIFDQDSRRRRFCKWFISFTVVWGLFYTAPNWVPCLPVASLWEAFPNQPRHCWGFASPNLSQSLGFHISQAVTTTLLDLIIFLLPLHLIFKPKTHQKSRIALICLFGLGLVVSLCSITRLIYLLKPVPNPMSDPSWNGPTPTALAVIESSLASMCAALPVFWPIIEKAWGMILVRYEVSVTYEPGIFIPRKKKKANNNKQLQGVRPSGMELTRYQTGSSSSQNELPQFLREGGEGGDLEDLGGPPEWDPYVGDATTGLGETDTIVQSPAEGPPRNGKGVGFCLY
ncbi:Rhodopsin domain-containing protein [Madurella fahalii]|uniref:Rhodopsin domain-containing protein n=1 Tax=Madurella fahalii TaxID=1157608 RepID=A0ABQ0G1X4_9PEZI